MTRDQLPRLTSEVLVIDQRHSCHDLSLFFLPRIRVPVRSYLARTRLREPFSVSFGGSVVLSQVVP